LAVTNRHRANLAPISLRMRGWRPGITSHAAPTSRCPSRKRSREIHQTLACLRAVWSCTLPSRVLWWLGLLGERAMTHQRSRSSADHGRQARDPRHARARGIGAAQARRRMTVDAIIIDHPRLTPDDILAAQAFAADYIADEDVVYG